MNDPRTNHDPLDADTLLAYHRGELDADARLAVQLRLAGDPAAVRLLLDLDAGPSLATAPSDTALSAGDVASAWGRFEAVIAENDEQMDVAAEVLPFARPTHAAPTRPVWRQHALALAATLAMAVLGLAGATSWLQVDSDDTQPTAREAALTAPAAEPATPEPTLIASFGDGEEANGWVTVGARNESEGTSLFTESFETAALPTAEASPAQDARSEIFDSSFRQHELDGWSTVVGAN